MKKRLIITERDIHLQAAEVNHQEKSKAELEKEREIMIEVAAGTRAKAEIKVKTNQGIDLINDYIL